MTSRVLILGGTGILGSALVRYLNNSMCLAPTRHELDLTKLVSLNRYITELKPNIIFNVCAIKGDKAVTRDEKLARAINVNLPLMLANIASELSFSLVHASSDSVFGGSQNGPFRDNDQINPSGPYGEMKAEAEEHIRSNCKAFIIARFGPMYGLSRSSHNTVELIVRKLISNSYLDLDDKYQYSFVYAKTLAPRLLALVNRTVYGVFNFSNAEPVTWAELINQFAIKLKIQRRFTKCGERVNKSLLNSHGSEFILPKLNSCLTEYLKDDFGKIR
jgi:dTDP-4-dehydrorhamnose reductase